MNWQVIKSQSEQCPENENPTEISAQNISENETELTNQRNEKHKGLIIRAKAKWSENSTNYF